MKPGSPSYTVVDLDERWQVLYWTTAMQCHETDLRTAVLAVGPDAAMVREHLGKIRMFARYAARPGAHFWL